jgi:hypothetical protein
MDQELSIMNNMNDEKESGDRIQNSGEPHTL